MARTLNFPEVVPELVGESVRLRALTEDDIPAWFARATDVESADLAGDPVPKSIGMGLPWLQKQRDCLRQRTGIRWAIVPTGSTVSVGTVGLTIKPNVERTAELGIVIARAHWRMGIATAVSDLVNHYAFTTLGLVEIQAEVLERNFASIRLLEKVGFHRVCVLPPTAVEPEGLLLYVLTRRGPSAA